MLHINLLFTAVKKILTSCTPLLSLNFCTHCQWIYFLLTEILLFSPPPLRFPTWEIATEKNNWREKTPKSKSSVKKKRNKHYLSNMMYFSEQLIIQIINNVPHLLSSFLRVLLRWNWHTMQFTHLKYTIQCFSEQPSPWSDFKTFSFHFP